MHSFDEITDASEQPEEGLEAPEGWGFEPRWLLVIMVSIPLAGALFWWLGVRYFDSLLSFLEYQQFVIMVAIAVAGGYQLYFWVQRNDVGRPAVCVKLPIDDRIPFQPAWIWPYSFLYYLMLGLTVISIRDLNEGVHIIVGGILLLVTGCLVFYLLPTYVPPAFRRFEVNGLSTRYLAFVQSIDNDRNAFPSMHCALATYVGMIVMELPLIGVWLGSGYIALIVISCLLVKQHVVIDTFGGVVLGAIVFEFNEMLPVWLN